MALISKRPFKELLLAVNGDKEVNTNHILEPEFHQDLYRESAIQAQKSPHGAFQIGEVGILTRAANRGKQPEYVDDQDDPETLVFIGKISSDGNRLTEADTRNVAALKSIAIRTGFVDMDSARAVSEEYFNRNKTRSGVIRGDVLINSTGDGTIGRVAVYHYDFPAVVDGHVTILRFHNLELAWYTAAYLLTEAGQHQLYRYINGSSGQVEIYPQDISRLWIPRQSAQRQSDTSSALQQACEQFELFRESMRLSLSLAVNSN